MSHNNLNGLFFPAVAGLFFFMKRPKVEEIEVIHPVYTRDPSGLAGVAKYIENQKAILLTNQNAELREVAEPITESTGVDKYLENRDKFTISWDSKYMLRQAIAEKQQKQTNVEFKSTGVDKYLKSRKEIPGLSGVSKYLKHQASLPQPSRVAKYMAKQAILAATQTKEIKHTVTKFEKTGVARYLQHQESLPQPSRVAKYMAKQAALAALQVKKKPVEIELTGVAKYLQYQASLPQPSRVAKYMAKQAAIAAKQEKQAVIPVVSSTGVAKYLKHQEDMPQASKVAKYMARQALVEKQKTIVIETGVDKYMRQQF